jgi:hypothetical protein
MKYYVYISDAKVDMLLPQIPHEDKRRIATELKIDLKILSAARKTEADIEDNRIKRLEAVCNFISEYGNVGSVDEPDEYIAGTLLLNWGDIRYWKFEDANAVFFTGETEQSYVGLGGSAKHVIGSTSNKDHYMANSTFPHLVYVLIRSFENTLIPSDKSLLLKCRKLLEEVEIKSHKPPLTESKIEHLALDALGYAVMYGQSMLPAQRLEFLAKRLFYGRNPKKKYILATPIYVAMAD